MKDLATDVKMGQALVIIALVTIVTVVILGGFRYVKFYNSVFRLSPSEVSASLSSISTKCKKIKECNLQEGDILMRRYITERTRLIDKIAHPYFTHSAFYLGNDQIVEAVGTEKNPHDDIQVAILSKSDWFNEDVNNFIILRPKKYGSHLENIQNNLKQIAEDPDYIFGIPEIGQKKTTCADLIFNELIKVGVVKAPLDNKIITPDFLFYTLLSNPDDFEVVGYGLITDHNAKNDNRNYQNNLNPHN